MSFVSFSDLILISISHNINVQLKRNKMKKLSAFFLVALGLCGLVACGPTSNSISEKQILKECNRILEEKGNDTATVNVMTGYYELNDQESRCMLKRLEAAGLITYNVERFAWWNSKKETKRVIDHYVERYYWFSYSKEPVYVTKKYTTYDFEQHFMVNVALTESGEALALNHVPSGVAIEDKDMAEPEFDFSICPENNVDCSESWPEIPHPKAGEAFAKCMEIINEARTMAEMATDCKTLDKSEKKCDEIERVDYVDDMTRDQINEINSSIADIAAFVASRKNELGCNVEAEPAQQEVVMATDTKEDEVEEEDPQKIAYNKAKLMENSDNRVLMAYKYKAVKARNIQILMQGIVPMAKAEVIYEVSNVTDAARVLLNAVDKTRNLKKEGFMFFVDKGWKYADERITEKDTNEFE